MLTRRAAVVSLLVLGTLGAASAQQPSQLTIAYSSDIPSWDPQSQTSGPAMSILNSVFDTPIGQTPEMKLVPRVINEWRWSTDKLALHVKLRDDIWFHNGDKLTAADLKFTFDRYKKETHPQSATYRRVKEVIQDGEYEATFVLAQPFATLPARLSIFGSAVVPKNYMEKVGVAGFIQNPIGSGPYKLVSYNRDARIVFEAFDKYWGGAPPIKNVTFEIVKDPTARVAAIEAGRVDFALEVPNRIVPRLAGLPGLTAAALPYPAQLQLLMVTNRGAFQDENIRFAVRHAIDKAGLARAFYNGVAVPIAVLSPPGFPGDAPDVKIEFSEAKAKEYLAKSGFSPTNPAKIDFVTTNGVYPNDFDVARAIQQMLKKVGIEATLEVIELAKYYELNHSNKLPEMTLFHWSNPTGDPEVYPGGILDSNRPFSAWKGKEAGDMVAKLFNETDDAKRIAGYVELNRVAAEKAWVIPLLQPTQTIVHKKDLVFTPYQTGWLNVFSMRWK